MAGFFVQDGGKNERDETVKAIGYIFSGLLTLCGFVFCAAAVSTGLWQRWILGGVLLGAGIAVAFIVKMKGPKTTVIRKIDLSGDVRLEDMTCRKCGGGLSPESVSIHAGAVHVKCPFCQSDYHLEEAPKW